MSQPDHPVVNISWLDALTYAAWLTQQTSMLWRLPTEAEWEKAARGTDGRAYPWGDEWGKSRANTCLSKHKTTVAIGTYPLGASPYGVQDMAGNVWEWCHSLNKPYPYRSDDGREDEPEPSNNRSLRGGSWSNMPKYARTTTRNAGSLPGYRNYTVGFRLVCAKK